MRLENIFVIQWQLTSNTACFNDSYLAASYTAWYAATAGDGCAWVVKEVGVGRRAGAAAIGGGVPVGVLGAWVYMTGGLLGGREPG